LDDFTEIVRVYRTIISNEIIAIQFNIGNKIDIKACCSNPLMKSLIKSFDLTCYKGYKYNINNARLLSDEAKRENALIDMESQVHSLKRFKVIKAQKLKLDAHLQSEESKTILKLSESSKIELKLKKVFSKEDERLSLNSNLEILNSKTTKTSFISKKLKDFTIQNLRHEIKTC
jgi:hypothetical protein